MSTQIVTLDALLIRSLALTPEKAEAAGLHPGSRLSVSVSDGRITLEPLSLETKLEMIGELYGLYASTPGLVEELQQERRQDKW